MLVWLALIQLVCGDDDQEKTASSMPAVPTIITLDALNSAPQDYSYCIVRIREGNRYWNGDTWSRFSNNGSTYEYTVFSPIVTTWTDYPGSVTATFTFYNEDDRKILSVSRSARVDADGWTHYGDSWDYEQGWSYNRNWRYANSYRDHYGTDTDFVSPDINQPWPKAGLTATVSGTGPWTVVINASDNLPDGNIISHEWDLNHDGSFNLNSGRSPRLERSLTKPGKYIFTVRITDLRGYSAVAECSVTVK